METINKITLQQLGVAEDWKEAIIVFTNESLNGVVDYTLEERSYKVYSSEKWFDSSMIGTSLYGNCLDGRDKNVRLDWYIRRLPEEGRRWIVEYCYIAE